MTRQPTRSEIEDYLDPKYFEAQAHGSTSMHYRDQMRNYRRLIEPYAGKRVLDIGSGSGKTVALMSATARPIALDFSPLSVRMAQATIAQQGDPQNAAVVQARGEVLPFSDNTFDMVTALDFVEHINAEEYDTLLREVYRVLKPGGVFCIYTPNKTYFIEYIYKLLYGRSYHPQHFGLKTVPQLVKPLQAAGYRIDHVSTQPNYLPGLRQFEQVFMRLPLVGQLAQRRVSIRAIKA